MNGFSKLVNFPCDIAFGDIASRNFETLWLFTRLLAMASVQEPEIMRGGKLIAVSPGQVATSLDELSFNGKCDIQKVRRALVYLEKRKSIQQTSDNQGRIITICNWADYQASKKELTNNTTIKEDTKVSEIKPIRKRIKKELIHVKTPEELVKAIGEEGIETLLTNFPQELIDHEFPFMAIWLSVNEPKKNYLSFATNWLRKATKQQEEQVKKNQNNFGYMQFKGDK